MTKFEELDSPNHPNYIPKQYGPGTWTIDDFTDMGEEEADEPFSFSAELVNNCAAFFGDCSRDLHPGYSMTDHGAVADLLVEAGVCTKKEASPESGCFYVYYSTREDAEGFIERFNAYLQKRLDTEPKTKAFHERLLQLRSDWEARIKTAVKQNRGWVPEATGLETLQKTLNDPNGEYVVMAQRDLTAIGELAERLGFKDELRALGIEIEKYEDVAKGPQ
jgi:hypothetical protein